MIDHYCQVWLDTSKGKNKRTLIQCIQAAQASHKRRTGQSATVCYINTDTHPDAPATVENVQIRRDKGVQVNQYWMAANGVEAEPAPEPAEEAVADEPASPEPEYYRVCPYDDCGAEQVVVSQWCWHCKRDLTIKETA